MVFKMLKCKKSFCDVITLVLYTLKKSLYQTNILKLTPILECWQNGFSHRKPTKVAGGNETIKPNPGTVFIPISDQGT